MNKIVLRKITALSLALVIVASVLAPITSSRASKLALEPEKHETIYVNLNSDGSRRNVIASTWIQNSGDQAEFKDSTILADVESVSGANLVQNNAGDLVWDTNGDDVYYQSEVDKEVPVDVDISYFLDGVEMTPDEIAGKSGKAKIHIALKNNDRHGKLYTPFMAVTVVPLKNEVFTDVTVTDGKIFSDGNSKMVICIGFPSLEEMLDLKNENIDPLKDLDFPDEFTIEANVENFELATIGIAVSPEIPDVIKDMENDEDIKSDIKDVEDLIDAKESMEEADPDDVLKNFIKDDDKVSRSRNLINDLYDFYDLDTSILEDLEEFVTDENIGLVDKLKDDAKKYQAEEMLDNEVIKNILKRLDSEHIEKAEKLIKWHDEFKNFDEDKLDGFEIMMDNRDELEEVIDKAKAIIDDVDEHEKEIDNMDVLIGARPKIESLIDKMETATGSSSTTGAATMITPEDIDVMKEALVNKKTNDIMSAYYDKLFDENGNLNNPATPFPDLREKFNYAIYQTSSPAATIFKPAIDSDQILIVKARSPILIEGMRFKMKEPIRLEVQRGVQAKVDSGFASFDSKMNSAKYLSSAAGGIKTYFINELGTDYKKTLKESLDYMEDLKKDIDELEELKEKNKEEIDQAREVMDDKDTLDYLEEWKDKLELAKDDIDANDDNVEIMRDLINEYKKPVVKLFYDNIPTLIDDMEALRPVATRFRDMIEEPQNDKIVHDMPDTLPTLIRMRRDILNNRDITDTLSLGTDEKVVAAAKKVINIIDAKDHDNKLNEMRDELKSVDNILDKKEELLALSESYDKFTGKESELKSHVSFILKTDAIEAPEEEKEEVVTDEDEDASFFGWIKSIFEKVVDKINFWS